MLQGLSVLFAQQAKPPQKITLTDCAVLSAKKLEPFLHEELTHLDLRRSSLELIPLKLVDCPLTGLYLSGCRNLFSFEYAEVVRFRRTTSPVVLPRLEKLHIDHCPQLTAIQLETEGLQVLKAGHNPQLARVSIRKIKGFTSIDFTGSPQVNVEQLLTESHPELCKKFNGTFSVILIGYMEGWLKQQSYDLEKKTFLTEWLHLLKKAHPGRVFKEFDSNALLSMEFTINTVTIVELRVLCTMLFHFRLPLTSLRLNQNDIGDEGVKAFAAILPQTLLTSLDLSRNGIGDEGAKAFIAVLPQTRITSLELSDEGVSYETQKLFKNLKNKDGVKISVTFSYS